MDFAQQPTYQPVAQVGLAFAGGARRTTWAPQAFRNSPGFWEFRKVPSEPLVKWRAACEERVAAQRDAAMERFHGTAWAVDADVRVHSERTAQREGRGITEAEAADLRGMLAVRGVLPAPKYDDEPQPGPRGLRGGGGRTQKMGMQAPRAKRCRASSEIADQEHIEPPADAAAGPFPHRKRLSGPGRADT